MCVCLKGAADFGCLLRWIEEVGEEVESEGQVEMLLLLLLPLLLRSTPNAANGGFRELGGRSNNETPKTYRRCETDVAPASHLIPHRGAGPVGHLSVGQWMECMESMDKG